MNDLAFACMHITVPDSVKEALIITCQQCLRMCSSVLNIHFFMYVFTVHLSALLTHYRDICRFGWLYCCLVHNTSSALLLHVCQCGEEPPQQDVCSTSQSSSEVL